MKLVWASGALAVVLLTVGTLLGFLYAPVEQYMGITQKIMYVHVPTAWTTLLTFTVAFVASVAWLVGRKWKWDYLLESTIEVGIVLGCLLSVQGAIWARPTWGVWWDWDPRLTSVAVMVLSYAGIAALRSFVDDPVKRATWSAVASAVGYVNVIFVYLCVKWLRTLHQPQSSPSTVDAAMVLPLRVNAFGMIFLAVFLIALRYRMARSERARELEA